MKVSNGIFLLIVLATFVLTPTSATAQDPRELVITHFKWSRNFHRPDWDKDNFGPENRRAHAVNVQRQRDEGEVVAKSQDGDDGAKAGSKTAAQSQPAHIIDDSHSPTPRKIYEEYLYTLTAKNAGAKTIKTLDWDYLFIDSETGKEIARHHFTSIVNIRPAAQQKVIEADIAPPSRVITAKGLDKKAGNPFTERVIVNAIRYSDGSVWRRSANALQR